MVGAYKPVAEFIKVARRIDMNPTFVNISFVGSGALAEELGRDGEGVVITQVVPLPWDGSIPLVQQYQAAMATLDRSEEHTSELQSLMRSSYAVFCLTKKRTSPLYRDYHGKVMK